LNLTLVTEVTVGYIMSAWEETYVLSLAGTQVSIQGYRKRWTGFETAIT